MTELHLRQMQVTHPIQVVVNLPTGGAQIILKANQVSYIN